MRDDERVIEDGDIPDSMPASDAADDDLVEPYDEADEADFDEDLDDEPLAEGEAAAELESDALPGAAESACESKFVAPVFNNFMDALYPAKPPAAQNARIVRRFDLEAAKYDPRPAPVPGSAPAPTMPTDVVTPPKPEKKEPALTREEARAMRNRSLRAAAGLG